MREYFREDYDRYYCEAMALVDHGHYRKCDTIRFEYPKPLEFSGWKRISTWG